MGPNDGSPPLSDPSSQASKPFSLPAPLAPGVRLNPDLIHRPDPITLYLSFWGTRNWHRKINAAVTRVVESGSLDINRPLTQPELDFHVENTSKSIYQARVGATGGILAGITHATLWERNGKVFDRYAPNNEDMVPAKRLFEGVKNMYKLDPVMFRASAVSILTKISVWTFSIWLFSTTYAVSSGVARMATDPRIREFFDERKHQDPKELQERHRKAALVKVYAMKQQNEQLPGVSSAGPQQETSEDSWYEGPSGTSASRTPNPDTYNYNAPTENEKKGGGFFDDDASPIAAEHRDTAQQGSAWDRVRRQNNPQGSQLYSVTQPTDPRPRSDDFEAKSTTPEDQDNSSQGSAWDRLRSQGPSQSSMPQPRFSRTRPGVSDTSNDGQREREQAQAEFDRMLEEERSRGSDSDPGKQRTGWWK